MSVGATSSINHAKVSEFSSQQTEQRVCIVQDEIQRCHLKTCCDISVAFTSNLFKSKIVVA